MQGLSPSTPSRVSWRLPEKEEGNTVSYSAQREAEKSLLVQKKVSSARWSHDEEVSKSARLSNMAGESSSPASSDQDVGLTISPPASMFGMVDHFNDGYEALPDVEKGVRRGGWRGAIEGLRHLDDESNITRQLLDDVFGKSPMQRAERRCILGFALVVVCSLLMMTNVGGKSKAHDFGGDSSQNLMLAGHRLCGGFTPRKDLFDKDSQMCKMENSLAFASFAGLSWVTCDTNLPGAKVLQQTVDEQGNFWYHHQAKNIVDKFYKTCKPDCAGEKDWWDRVGQVCVSVDTALNEWVEACKDSGADSCYSPKGRGLRCDQRLVGTSKLRVVSSSIIGADPNAPSGGGSFKVSYKPADSRDVEALAKSCSPMCAEGDTVDQGDGGWCDVVNAKAITFLQARSNGTSSPYACDGALQGALEIEARVGKSYAYPSTRLNAVRLFYASCVQGG